MEKKEYDKLYYKNNRAKILSQNADYYKANKDKVKLYQKSWHNSNKLSYYIVYALPNYRNNNKVYCGMTQNPYRRMIKHNQDNNNTEGWFILDVCKTKREALNLERAYHNSSYKGIIR
mgnify:CR=1 FL=1|tara:strand:+ start:45 stop:398 length:354 start_codon:yes stop_codon:yes gene_type:complete